MVHPEGGRVTPGIYPKLSMEEYLALPYLSSGLLHTLLCQSPFHARHQQEHREDDASEASDTGTAIHDSLLEGIDRLVGCPFDDWRKNAAKEMRDEARAAGKLPVLEYKMPNINGAVESASTFLMNSELGVSLLDGLAEHTIVWHEEEHGQTHPILPLPCKARPDWLSPDRQIMIHVKSTKGSAQPDSWIRNQLVPSGYDVTLAFYERGLSVQQSVFLVIEQQPPFGCSLVALAPAMRELADTKVTRALRTWAQCVATNKWPAYPSRICYAEPKPWMMAEEEEQQLSETYDRLQEKEGLQA